MLVLEYFKILGEFLVDRIKEITIMDIVFYMLIPCLVIFLYSIDIVMTLVLSIFVVFTLIVFCFVFYADDNMIYFKRTCYLLIFVFVCFICVNVEEKHKKTNINITGYVINYKGITKIIKEPKCKCNYNISIKEYSFLGFKQNTINLECYIDEKNIQMID